MKKSNASVPSFNVRPLVAACGVAEKAFIKAQAAHGIALDKTADAFRKAGVTVEMLKGNARTSVPREIIKKFFDGLSDKIYKDSEGKEVRNPTAAAIEKGKLELVRDFIISKSTAATYQNCFWIAFEKNIPFSPSLANQQSKERAANGGKTPGKTPGRGKGKTPGKAPGKAPGSGVTASRDNLQSLLMQTIKMARDLSLGDFAIELVEAGRDIELLPKNFK